MDLEASAGGARNSKERQLKRAPFAGCDAPRERPIQPRPARFQKVRRRAAARPKAQVLRRLDALWELVHHPEAVLCGVGRTVSLAANNRG